MDAKYRAVDANTYFDALDSFQQRSYDLMRSPAAKKAFDIDAEPQALREKYGRTPVGQGALLARRLVEGGVRFVTVAKGWLNYDTHGDNFNIMKKVLLPEFDRAFAALLEDLHQRGMLDSTLVIAMGEFGRTPKVNGDTGRDHHNKAWSIALSPARHSGRSGTRRDRQDRHRSDRSAGAARPAAHYLRHLGVDSTRSIKRPLDGHPKS
jgi:uncharacterized protein (DUF1501 family)